MNKQSYIRTIRNGLCRVLTSQRDNMEEIQKLNDSLDMIHIANHNGLSENSVMIVSELFKEIDFINVIGEFLELEVLRLIKILQNDNSSNK